jgi:hypothetical protein
MSPVRFTVEAVSITLQSAVPKRLKALPSTRRLAQNKLSFPGSGGHDWAEASLKNYEF